MTTWLNVKNNAQSALYAGITAAATSLTLLAGEGAKFPASNFNISIDDEILLCTTRTVDVLTVTRAQEGTTAAIHAVGATVTLNVTAGIISQLQAAIDAGGSGSGITLDNTAGGTSGATTTAPTSNALFNSVRPKLTAVRTYYVRPDGSDSNTGLVNTSAGAFLTVQKAIDIVATLDCSIYDVTIQLGAGTYTLTTQLILKSIVGSGSVIIIGDETTPTNVIVDVVSCSAFTAISIPYTIYKLRGMQIRSSTANGGSGILSSTNSNIEFQNLNFGAGLGQQIRADDGGRIKCTGNYTISGGGMNHLVGVNGLIRIQAVTVTVTGTPAFTDAFINAGYNSTCVVNSITFSGSATGVRYIVASNSVVFCGGVSTYFPGGTAGSTATGGQYI
jgi:hypothetical protein